MEKTKKIAIVGAGVSGLATCKHLLDKGFHPVVFDSDNTIGGVWTSTLQSTRLQATTAAYRFADHPWPPEVTDKFPDHTSVLDYINSYARRFGLLRCCRLNCTVTAMEYAGAGEDEIGQWELWSGNGEPFGGGEWRLTVHDSKLGTTEVESADFVVLCVGRHSGYPNIPGFPPGGGPEAFRGTAMHSMDYSNTADAAKLVSGKRVAVVGSGKSAFDIAAECARANGPANPCTMVFRTKHWLLPQDDAGVADHLGYLYLSRASQLLVCKPGDGLLKNLLATLLSPVRWGISKLVEAQLMRRIPLRKHGMVPEYSFSDAVSACLFANLPAGFYDMVEEGSIVLKNSKEFRFCGDGLELEDGAEVVGSDVVILATGFRGDQKLRDMFASPHFAKIVAGSSDSAVPLYRECIHPDIPQLAVVGYAESLTHLYAAERMSNWVAHLLAGSFRLPAVKAMREDVERWSEYKRRYTKEYFRRSAISTVNIWLNDLLCRDIGADPRRKSGLLAEWFEPYGPADYAGML